MTGTLCQARRNFLQVLYYMACSWQRQIISPSLNCTSEDHFRVSSLHNDGGGHLQGPLYECCKLQALDRCPCLVLDTKSIHDLTTFHKLFYKSDFFHVPSYFPCMCSGPGIGCIGEMNFSSISLSHVSVMEEKFRRHGAIPLKLKAYTYIRGALSSVNKRASEFARW